MKRKAIKDLQEGMEVESIYLVCSLKKNKKKNGEDYISLSLGDATGEIAAVIWDDVDAFLQNRIKTNDFVKINGTVGRYQERLQLTLNKVERVDETEVNLGDFILHTPYDIEDLKQQLFRFINQVTDEHLKALLNKFFMDDKFMEAFARAPSAKTMHQAYIGGLLEHTVGVCKNAVAIANNYPGCNYSLLITGALLHDIGKIKEFTIHRYIEYTDEGRLKGHIIISIEMINDKFSQLESFPVEKKVLLEHLIISHHGYKEWGSPKRPKTMEALILHWADYIDAYLSTYLEVIRKCREQGYRWSEWNRMFERYLFAGFDAPIDASPPQPAESLPTEALES